MSILESVDKSYSTMQILQREQSIVAFLSQRFYLLLINVTLTFIIVQFIVFKYFYPYAGFINGDSYSYILSAFYNLRVDTYPIGYPKFLRLFSVFSYTDTSLIAFQYFFIEISSIMLLLTIFFFYNPRKWVQVTLILLITLNPAFLYLSNYVSSDSLFLGLSIIWFTHLIWIMNRPTLQIILSHSIIIFLAFTVRYNALFYPMIAAAAFFIDRRSLTIKILGLMLTAILLFLFINYTSGQFQRITKVKQFSPFSGWQMANNALYAYRFVDSANRKELPSRFKELDNTVRNYFDSTRDVNLHPQEMLYASTVYMWDLRSPLTIFKDKYKNYDSSVGDLTKWANVGPIYNDYGFQLIKTYPGTFIRYYIWPNFLKYYVPPVEFLGSYSTGVDTVPIAAKQWFWFSGNKLIHKTDSMKVNTLDLYPILYATSNVIFLSLSVSFIFLGGMRSSPHLFKLLLLLITFWILNLAFSVFASPIALRFQLFPFLLVTAMNFILLDSILIEKKFRGTSHNSYMEKPLLHNNSLV